MNASINRTGKLTAAAVALALLAGCSATPARLQPAADARSKLTQLQADPQLATRAPVAINDAELAVRAAEAPRDDHEWTNHLVVIADRKVDIAWALARTRLAEDEREGLSQAREAARLDARTREADAARSSADLARTDADIARQQSAKARADAESARTQSVSARADATMARTQAAIAQGDAEVARSQADSARRSAEASQQQTDDLQRQIAELNARATDRGLVVTLGDVLFATGRSDLKSGAAGNLGKLATFLNTYTDRTVIIEGHTDNVGSDASNVGLSQRRADSVKSFLLSQGVASSRVSATGMGEGSPASGNDSATGRQMNRRVEVIISNIVTSSR